VPVARPLKLDFSYSCAAVDKISTYTERRAVPLRQMNFLYQPTVVNGFKTDYKAITKFSRIKLVAVRILLSVVKLPKSKR